MWSGQAVEPLLVMGIVGKTVASATSIVRRGNLLMALFQKDSTYYIAVIIRLVTMSIICSWGHMQTT